MRDDETGTVAAAVSRQHIALWQGTTLLDCDGAKIGKLVDVYVDIETDEPMFGTVKERRFSRRLTFVPLIGIAIGRDNLRTAVARESVENAPTIEPLEGLSQEDESGVYRHYELDYATPETQSGRRLARR